jgi:hypothetical protein
MEVCTSLTAQLVQINSATRQIGAPAIALGNHTTVATPPLPLRHGPERQHRNGMENTLLFNTTAASLEAAITSNKATSAALRHQEDSHTSSSKANLTHTERMME